MPFKVAGGLSPPMAAGIASTTTFHDGPKELIDTRGQRLGFNICAEWKDGIGNRIPSKFDQVVPLSGHKQITK